MADWTAEYDAIIEDLQQAFSELNDDPDSPLEGYSTAAYAEGGIDLEVPSGRTYVIRVRRVR